MSRKPYSLTKPCSLCPFRNDVRPYLSAERVREIEASLDRSEFPCHETTGAKSGKKDTGNHVHCAGALILMEKEGRSSQMMRIAHRLGMYDPDKLDMQAPVFETFDEMIDAQPSARSRARRRSRHK